MSFFDIFSTSAKAVEAAADAATTIVKGGVEMMDEAFDSPEERREHHNKMFEMWMKMQETASSQRSPTSVSRRWVAWGVLSLVWIATVLSLALIIFSATYTAQIAAIVAVLKALGVAWAFSGVIVFYFGPHLVTAFKGK